MYVFTAKDSEHLETAKMSSTIANGIIFTVFLYVNRCSPELKHFFPIVSIELEHCKEPKTPPCVTTLLTLTLSVSPTEVVPIGYIH